MFVLTVLFDHQSLLVPISAPLSCLYSRSNCIRFPYNQSKLERLGRIRSVRKAILPGESFD